MQHNVFDQGQLDFLQERNALFIDCFLNTPVHFLFFILFIFAFRDKPAQWWGCCGITGSLLRLVNRHAHPACPAASFLGGWGGKHWETSLELLLIPNIMFLLCAQNHTPVFKKNCVFSLRHEDKDEGEGEGKKERVENVGHVERENSTQSSCDVSPKGKRRK